MSHNLPSPVSPLEESPVLAPNPTPPQTQETAGSDNDNSSLTVSPSLRKGDWIPFTLRWYFLVVPMTLSLCLGIVLAYLCWHSQRYYGLGADDGSSAILFGWRFTPTLIAVLYAQMTVIIFEDIKRTEPFARLAKPSPGGSSAYGTVLQTPRAWWTVFIDVAFKRKKVGKTSWSLICSALINVLALLAISPLSSALLTSEEVLVPKPIGFTRIVPKADTQIPTVANRETYFRTISALTRNVSTSAWISDQSLTLPFWPSSEHAQVGPSLTSNYGAWKTETIAMRSALDCQNMTLESADLSMKEYRGAYSLQRYGPYNGTQPMVTFVLTSSDKCRYELSMHPAADLAYKGGLTWSNASVFYPDSGSRFTVGTVLYMANITMNGTSTSPFARLNSSSECRNRDIIIMSTPWTARFNSTSFTPVNQTYERLPTFEMKGLICEPRYTMINRTISASPSKSSATKLEDAPGIGGSLDAIPQSLVDLDGFQARSLVNDWWYYFDQDAMNGEAKFKATGDSGEFAPPVLSGMAPILAAYWDFDLKSMMNDPQIAEKAARIKGRFFMETLRESFNRPDVLEQNVVQGEATIIEERVVVLTEIGVALATFFFVSFFLLILVFWFSRLSRRPLQLQSDPASTVGMSLLLDPRFARASTFRSLHDSSKVDIRTALRRETYFTSNCTLHTDASGANGSDTTTKKSKRDWRPRVIHVRMLVALSSFLALVLVAILTLNVFSARSKLSQVAFIYEADVSKFGLSFSTFAPISIAPTVISIIVGLWWDQLDMTFRILQPYISMSRSPTPISMGAGLTYRSKTWAGAAFKAGRNRHWVLFLIAIGSVLAQVLTVSMSALFEREAGNVTRDISLNRTLEPRQVPLVNQIGAAGEGDAPNHSARVLHDILSNTTQNWLFGAATQSFFNGSQQPWTFDDWNFIPIDLTNIPSSSSKQRPVSTGSDSTPFFSANITVHTPAIRVRLECNQVEEIANQSSWIDQVEPDDYLKDYLLHMPDSDAAEFNATGIETWYALPNSIFPGTDSHTTVLSSASYVACCQNGTIAKPGTATIGYWSVVEAPDWDTVTDDYPWPDRRWPLSISVKWIVGRPRLAVDRYRGLDGLLFDEIPSLQAAQCVPIVETTEAKITIDQSTKKIHSYSLTGPPKTADSAWLDTYIRHDLSNTDQHYDTNYAGPLNMTSSYGVLFLGSLIASSDRTQPGSGRAGGYSEDTSENAFIIRDNENGVNMDLMSYSMYALANKDPEALLNYTTLVRHANTTLQTFFQYFINNGLTVDDGGYAYQKINDKSMETLGRRIDENGTAIAEGNFPALNTNRTAIASVSNRIQLLHMNPTATYLSSAILLWLIITSLIVSCLQRRYTSSMVRDVEVIADILVLVAGSDNFLKLVQDQGVALKRNKDIKTMLGWFRGKDGQIRWGVEVVGGRDAVQWVDTPKQGWHITEKSAYGQKLLAWRRKK